MPRPSRADARQQAVDADVRGVLAAPADARSFYNSSKSAVSGLMKCMACVGASRLTRSRSRMEWIEHGIRVNAVCPGFINTEQFVTVHRVV